ncbi:2-dehydropantoate 2-reductase [Clostridium sp. A1-XYC3]|uniref:2-dehydropantoate 2-reductase n=1 Tax=Clostridium tanneri TaxID=3037988 RepID=A0ABU4JWU6_9CLOT|nr:2-dehydropantoate 2-reductase [Clostridium sp. A1-XYC3]MDW8802608.1 2-dehydropantoate 2-reductase [Clostridium sp. A1-XYC3]
MKNILVIGLGAVGTAYASRLHDMNAKCLKVIASEERAKRYREQGFIINGKEYEFNYLTPKDQFNAADLIIVSVKTHQLSNAIKDMKRYVGRDTIILSLLNGISSEEILGDEFGMDKILYGLCIGIDAVREGNKSYFSSTGKVKFGEKKNTVYSSKVIAVKELFEKANIPYDIPENMFRELWWKFMVNVGINQASAILRAHYNVFQSTAEAKELMESAMWEVIKLSEKVGVNLNEKDILKWYEVLYSLDPSSRTSMLEDIECGRKTEVETFGGEVCRLGREYKIDTPVNQVMYNIIKVIERGV